MFRRFRALPPPRNPLIAALALAPLLALGAGLPAGASDGPREPAEPTSSPPVLLRDSMILTPLGAAGAGIAPELDVRLTVDERGQPKSVDILSITPSSEYDALFERAAVEAIEKWRYAPAREDGEPVEATLRWTIQFREATARGEGERPGLGLSPLWDQATRRARIFTLPEEKQVERLRHYAEAAESLLDSERRHRAESPRFVVVSDTPHAESAETLAQNLEAVFSQLDRIFGPAIQLQSADYKLLAYVYWSRSSLSRLGAELGAGEWANGFYFAPGLFAFHLESDSVHSVLGTLVHEAVHAYLDRHVTRPGIVLTPALSEGIASYFGNSEIEEGRLIPGQIREGRYVIDHRLGGAYRRATATGWSLEAARRAVRSDEALTPEQLLAMDRAVFYGQDLARHYSLSWLLVHYLRHGEPGWDEEEFPRLLLYLAEGYPASAAIEAVYGLSPEELAEPFQKHVRRL